MLKRTALLINTATIVGVAGVAVDGEVLAQTSLELASSSNGTVTAVDQVLAAAGLSVQDISEIIVVRGPGTFTGSRVGASIAKAISYVTSCALLSVTTLEAVAWTGLLQGPPDPPDGSVWALLDARRHEFYAQRFAIRGGELHEASEAICSGPDAFADIGRSRAIVACAFSDSLLPRVEEAEPRGKATTWLFNVYPDPAGILAAGRSAHREDPLRFEPVYLRTLEELFDHPEVKP